MRNVGSFKASLSTCCLYFYLFLLVVCSHLIFTILPLYIANVLIKSQLVLLPSLSVFPVCPCYPSTSITFPCLPSPPLCPVSLYSPFFLSFSPSMCFTPTLSLNLPISLSSVPLYLPLPCCGPWSAVSAASGRGPGS